MQDTPALFTEVRGTEILGSWGAGRGLEVLGGNAYHSAGLRAGVFWQRSHKALANMYKAESQGPRLGLWPFFVLAKKLQKITHLGDAPFPPGGVRYH